jgi:hypothetical protein
MSADETNEEDKIHQLIEEYNEDADKERVLNQIISVPVVSIIDPLNATVIEDWLGFISNDLILTYDRTIWTISRPSATKSWEIEDWDGNNDTINIDLTKDQIPWEKLLKIFCFDSPNELLELLDWNCAFEERVFRWMADLPGEASCSKIVADPIFSKWMTQFDPL